MKKTLTINLNNIVFHIDDDAYEMLQTYLSEIADHFKSEDEKKEIMADIEARIAELFTEKLQKNKNVINLNDVQEIVDIMGKPSQYTDEDENAEDETQSDKSDKSETSAEAPKSDKKRSHRFYRDPENAILGGICGGIAAYFDWDVTWVRIIMVALVLLGFGFIIPIYIVVWFIAPQAVTTAQRLEMQGLDVTVENIKSEMKNFKDYMESDKFKQNASNFGERVLEIMRWFFKIIFGFIGGILGIVGLVVVAVLIGVLFFLIFDPTAIGDFVPELVSSWGIISPEKMALLIISVILLVGCPIFMLIFWGVRLVSGRNNEKSKTTSWVVLVLWLAGLFMFYSIGANTIFHLNRNGKPFEITWNNNDNDYYNDTTKTDEIRVCEPFRAIEVAGNIKLILKQDSVREVRINAYPAYLPKIVTNVEDGVLHVYSKGMSNMRQIKVYVSCDTIQRIKAEGACVVRNESVINLPELLIELEGASITDMNINIAKRLKINLEGASKTDLRGTCYQLELKAEGASRINADELKSKFVLVDVEGASHADVYASESIDANAEGAAHIKCIGSPKKIKQSENIGSSINIE